MKLICRLLFSILVVGTGASVTNAQGFGSLDAMNRQARADYFYWLRYNKTKEEGGNMRKFWKGESTLGLTFTKPVTVIQQSRYDSIYTNTHSFDTVFQGTGKTLTCYHLEGDGNHMLVRIADNSIITFSFGVQADFLRYQLPEIGISETFNGTKGRMMVVSLGTPLTLDYKWGSDVDFNPDVRGCFAIGGGVMPGFTDALINTDYSSGGLRMPAYLYATAGFYAAGLWKLRVSYVPGNIPMFKDYEVLSGGVKTTLTVKGSNMFSIGLVFVRHSGDWRNARAWRQGWGGGGGDHSFHRHHSRPWGDRGNGRMF